MRNVVILVFPGANLLDVAGPAQVFTSAAELHRAANPGEETAYGVTLASLYGGLVATTSGIELNSSPLADICGNDIDTLLIAGGHGSEAAGNEPAIAAWLHDLRRQGEKTRFDLHRCFRIGCGGIGRRQAAGDSLGLLRSVGGRTSGDQRRTGRDLCGG